MTNKVIKTGNQYSIRSENAMTIYDTLPAQNYTVKFDERTGQYYLEPIDDFKIPSKLYGSPTKRAERILNTFDQRSGGTGVLLQGSKGSGKTLLAKYTSAIAREQGIPTVVVNQPHRGDEFNQFIQSIEGKCIIIFDEFEKVYEYHHQEQVLTLLDGVFNSQKLFFITTNDKHRVSNYMQNRPGRVYYNFVYKSLEEDFVRDYCDDNLNDKSQIQGIVNYCNVFSFFNFDMLQAAVEEMNRYDETFREVLEVLNITPESSDTRRYNSRAVFNDGQVIVNDIQTNIKYDPVGFEYYLEDCDFKDVEAKRLFAKMVAEMNGTSNNQPDNGEFALVAGSDDGFCIEQEDFVGYNEETKTFAYEVILGGVKLRYELKEVEAKFDIMDHFAF